MEEKKPEGKVVLMDGAICQICPSCCTLVHWKATECPQCHNSNLLPAQIRIGVDGLKDGDQR